jgi:hypothetical protein
MKKIIFILLTALLGSQVAFSQNQEQLAYGTVRSDGFNKITKGAFWSKRPKAKEVYEGLYPKDVEIILLTSDHFVRFVNKENNGRDNNYIVFPKGEKIYRDFISKKYYAAVCGNEVEFFQPVENTRIVVDTMYIVEHDTTFITHIEYVEVPQQTQQVEEKIKVIIVEREFEYSPSYTSYGFFPPLYWGTPICNHYCGSGANNNVNVKININNSNYNSSTSTVTADDGYRRTRGGHPANPGTPTTRGGHSAQGGSGNTNGGHSANGGRSTLNGGHYKSTNNVRDQYAQSQYQRTAKNTANNVVRNNGQQRQSQQGFKQGQNTVSRNVVRNGNRTVGHGNSRSYPTSMRSGNNGHSTRSSSGYSSLTRASNSSYSPPSRSTRPSSSVNTSGRVNGGPARNR